MIKGEFEFTIISAYDREKLTCEICYKKEIIAEISQETAELMIEIYPSQTEKWWTIPLVQFQQALEDAKNYLVGEIGN
jgi:hypothetical protein